ncbi:hypothetical protein OSB04_007872 [Centaurea solstitialis]|uniref:Protein kinase domain-containing protein n=1 Tax=Centaurea solstitialis TaxID=347529 RepID=A0AA38WIZ0_9ASTR|nr:hypothetical protein OSB04_007872 [Centaurea solstitialis]
MEPSRNETYVQYNSVQPESSDSVPSSQNFSNANARPASVKPVLNYSIRTGEEFALEFIRDRVNPRMPFVPYPAGDSSIPTSYMELKGILGISHTGSESGSDISMLNIVERGSKDHEGTSNYGSVSSVPPTSSEFNSTRAVVHDYASSGASDGSSKIKILCSFGGKILPRPSDGKLRYVGGETRIIRIRRDIFWQELRQKTIEIYIETYAIKYQLPGEDLDALVSVSSDEDLQNMMEECHVLGVGEGSKKLRLFLFSLSDLDDAHFGHANSGGDSEFQFVVAVNGMDMGSRRESGMHGLMRSSANNLSELDGQTAERNISRAATEFVGGNAPAATDLQGSSSLPASSPAMLPNPPNAYGNRNQIHQGLPVHYGEPNLNMQHHPTVSRPTADKLPAEISVPLNTDGIVDRQGGFTEGYPSRTTVVQNRQPQKEEKQKGDSSVKQEVKQANIRSPRDDGEGKLPPKPKMTEERHQDQIQVSPPLNAASMAKVAASNDNDSCTSSSALPPPDNSGSDLIDLSYLEPPAPPPGFIIPREFHGDRESIIDDSLGSQFLVTHLQSDAESQDFISESVGSLHTEDRPPQNELPPVSTGKLSHTNSQITYGGVGNNGKSKEAPHEPVEDHKPVNYDQVQNASNVSDATMINDKKVKFDKPVETGSQMTHQQKQPTSDFTASGAQVHAQPSAAKASRPEQQGDILIDLNDRFPRDFLSDVFTRAMAEDSPGFGVLPQDGAGLSLNIANHEPKHWSFFQKLARGEFKQKDVSLIDQDHLAFLSGLQNVEEEASAVYDVAKFQDGVSGSQLDSRKAAMEDEEKEITGSDSTSMQAHYNPSHMKSSEGMQFDDMAENMRIPDSEYEVETRNDGIPSIDLSLGDLDISSLQIIRNEDLEELRELGSGTFGTVYHGKWRGTDVAIKRIKKSCFAGRSSEQERLTIEFWREADILSKLHHPNVMAFYGVVQDGPDATLATVTEFMVDGSLRHVLLRKDRHLDHRKRLIIAMDAAFGMEYLHSKNIVHFDLKCDNLLVNMKDSSRPICKVGDFGLSKIKRNTLVSGGVRGTLPWMAPELLNGGSNKVSEKVDVFSFGIVLWEILTREEPYANMHYGAIIGGIVNNSLRPTIPSDCDPEWRRLMEQCWSPDPMVRPSFTEITNQLRVMSAACQSKGHAHKATGIIN